MDWTPKPQLWPWTPTGIFQYANFGPMEAGSSKTDNATTGSSSPNACHQDVISKDTSSEPESDRFAGDGSVRPPTGNRVTVCVSHPHPQPSQPSSATTKEQPCQPSSPTPDCRPSTSHFVGESTKTIRGDRLGCRLGEACGQQNWFALTDDKDAVVHPYPEHTLPWTHRYPNSWLQLGRSTQCTSNSVETEFKERMVSSMDSSLCHASGLEGNPPSTLKDATASRSAEDDKTKPQQAARVVPRGGVRGSTLPSEAAAQPLAPSTTSAAASSKNDPKYVRHLRAEFTSAVEPPSRPSQRLQCVAVGESAHETSATGGTPARVASAPDLQNGSSFRTRRQKAEIRQLICLTCRYMPRPSFPPALAPGTISFVPAKEVRHRVTSYYGPITEEELLEICSMVGDESNGGGRFETRTESGKTYLRWVTEPHSRSLTSWYSSLFGGKKEAKAAADESCSKDQTALIRDPGRRRAVSDTLPPTQCTPSARPKAHLSRPEADNASSNKASSSAQTAASAATAVPQSNAAGRPLCDRCGGPVEADGPAVNQRDAPIEQNQLPVGQRAQHGNTAEPATPPELQPEQTHPALKAAYPALAGELWAFYASADSPLYKMGAQRLEDNYHVVDTLKSMFEEWLAKRLWSFHGEDWCNSLLAEQLGQIIGWGRLITLVRRKDDNIHTITDRWGRESEARTADNRRSVSQIRERREEAAAAAANAPFPQNTVWPASNPSASGSNSRNTASSPFAAQGSAPVQSLGMQAHLQQPHMFPQFWTQPFDYGNYPFFAGHMNGRQGHYGGAPSSSQAAPAGGVHPAPVAAYPHLGHELQAWHSEERERRGRNDRMRSFRAGQEEDEEVPRESSGTSRAPCVVSSTTPPITTTSRRERPLVVSSSMSSPASAARPHVAPFSPPAHDLPFLPRLSPSAQAFLQETGSSLEGACQRRPGTLRAWHADRVRTWPPVAPVADIARELEAEWAAAQRATKLPPPPPPPPFQGGPQPQPRPQQFWCDTESLPAPRKRAKTQSPPLPPAVVHGDNSSTASPSSSSSSPSSPEIPPPIARSPAVPHSNNTAGASIRALQQSGDTLPPAPPPPQMAQAGAGDEKKNDNRRAPPPPEDVKRAAPGRRVVVTGPYRADQDVTQAARRQLEEGMERAEWGFGGLDEEEDDGDDAESADDGWSCAATAGLGEPSEPSPPGSDADWEDVVDAGSAPSGEGDGRGARGSVSVSGEEDYDVVRRGE